MCWEIAMPGGLLVGERRVVLEAERGVERLGRLGVRDGEADEDGAHEFVSP
jgi:hypothetical protein